MHDQTTPAVPAVKVKGRASTYWSALRAPIALRSPLVAAVAVAMMAGAFVTRPDLAARAAAGLAAHTICSAAFVSGLDPETTNREFVRLHVGDVLASLMSQQVDRDKMKVTATFAGVFSATASFREGYGCRLDLAGSDAAPRATPDIGPRNPITSAVESQDPAVQAALDAVFRERAGQPVKNVKAVVVMLDGRIVAERYAPGFGSGTPLLGYSVAKSITNALLGVLVHKGRLRVDQPVGASEWASVRDARAAITYEDLLRMRSGLDAAETGSGFDAATRMLYVHPDMAGFAAGRSLSHPPGSRWEYTSINTLILNRALGRAVGGGAPGMRAFAERELFKPLGMSDVTMEFDGRGVFVGSSYAYAPARAFARFGMLYVQDGVTRDGRRLLPEGWVEWSRRSTLGSPYGAGFWTNNGPSAQARGRVELGFPKDGFFASGNFGQRIYVVPSQRLVVSRFGYSAPPLFGLEEDIALIKAAMRSSAAHARSRAVLEHTASNPQAAKAGTAKLAPPRA